jgi:hypothetical protein
MHSWPSTSAGTRGPRPVLNRWIHGTTSRCDTVYRLQAVDDYHHEQALDRVARVAVGANTTAGSGSSRPSATTPAAGSPSTWLEGADRSRSGWGGDRFYAGGEVHTAGADLGQVRPHAGRRNPTHGQRRCRHRAIPNRSARRTSHRGHLRRQRTTPRNPRRLLSRQDQPKAADLRPRPLSRGGAGVSFRVWGDDHSVGGVQDRLVLLIPLHAVVLVPLPSEQLGDLSAAS